MPPDNNLKNITGHKRKMKKQSHKDKMHEHEGMEHMEHMKHAMHHMREAHKKMKHHYKSKEAMAGHKYNMSEKHHAREAAGLKKAMRKK